MSRQTILVLGGGNALGSYLAGAYESLSAAAIAPDWLVGASAGAITGAIIAGNPPERRVARLREFWEEAATKTGFAQSGNKKLRQYYNGFHALLSVLAGRPTIFRHRWPGLWSALQETPGLFRHGLPRGLKAFRPRSGLKSQKPGRRSEVSGHFSSSTIGRGRSRRIGCISFRSAAPLSPTARPIFLR